MLLNQLRDNAAARRKSKRLGRGIGSGKGKTCGKGVKGQKAREGVSLNGFEGGQLPLYRRLPKRGFTNINRQELQIVNLRTLSQAIKSGKINSSEIINEAALVKAGVVRPNIKTKLLGDGVLSYKINLEISAASAGAVSSVQAAGGTVNII